MERLDAVAAAFRELARVHAGGGYAPVYERMAAGVAGDRDLLAVAATARPGQFSPNLLLAAAQYLVSEYPDDPLARFYPALTGAPAPVTDPYPALRDFVLAHRGEVTALVSTRFVQTNEPARCTSLYPALLTAQHLGGERPLALIEVGPSAGLTLVPDRYAYDYGIGSRYGDLAAPLVLSCALRGEVVPTLSGTLRITWRTGVDPRPLDLTDPEDRRWLRALVWPDHPERAHRVDLAARAAARGPRPVLHQGDATERLPDLVAQAPADATLVVLHSSVLAHFTARSRAVFRQRLLDLSARRPITWLRNEPRRDDQPRLRLAHLAEGAVRARYPLAHCHPHGAWLSWVASVGVRVDPRPG